MFIKRLFSNQTGAPCNGAPIYRLLHVGEALDRGGKAFKRLIHIAVGDAVADAVLDVSFEHDFAAAVECGFRRVDLGEDVLAGDVLVDHPVNGLYLPDDLFQSAVQIVRVHALPHRVSPAFPLPDHCTG